MTGAAAPRLETSRDPVRRCAGIARDRATVDPQLDLGLRTAARPLRLSRDLRDIPLDRYRLPKDGRKWKAIARERMALAEWLGTHGDGDGSRIYPGVDSMIRHFGWSRRKTFYLLADLKELGLLSSAGLTSEHGTRKRRINLEAFHGAGVQDSPRAGVQDSRAGVQSNVAHDRHLTDRIQMVGGEQSSVSSLSARTDKPMTALSPRTLADKKERAKRILVEDGHDPDLVEIVLSRIDVLRASVKTVPRVVSYFVVAAENSLADPDELAMCRSIVAERRRAGIAIDAPLRPEECSDAAKVKFLHAAVEDSDCLGRRPAEIMAERMAAAGVAMG